MISFKFKRTGRVVSLQREVDYINAIGSRRLQTAFLQKMAQLETRLPDGQG